MGCKYQIIFLGNDDSLFNEIESGLKLRFKELNIGTTLLKVITMDNILEYFGGAPAFVIYSNINGQPNEEIRKVIENQKLDGNVILPVFYKDFSEEIPCYLSNYNGFPYKGKVSKITNIILEGFELLRKNRKIFISYKRSESSNVAIQLYEFLERNNFDVFIDTHSIDKGEEFQEELWHRMTDCDLIIMLNTKNFLESEWCKQELDKAHTKRIGIIHLLWPDCDFESFAQLAFSLKLENNDFEKPEFSDLERGRLKTDKLNEIIELVESSRARNLASRQDALITDFSQAAHNRDVEVNLQYSRYLTQVLPNGKSKVFIPTIGVPQSINCHNSEKLISKIEEREIDSITLIYDEMSIRNYWLEHLEWLNKFLTIKTLKKLDFNDYFSK